MHPLMAENDALLGLPSGPAALYHFASKHFQERPSQTWEMESTLPRKIQRASPLPVAWEEG